MKREIKFRAWDHQQNKFVNDTGDVRLSIGLEFGVDDYYLDGNGEKKTRFSFEQFTGLTDKNGVEVYEGDKIEWKEQHILFEVEWSQEDCGFVCYKHYPLSCGSMNQEYLNNFTIIGHIHQTEETV